MCHLRWDHRDIIAAPRLAFSLRVVRVGTVTVALTLAALTLSTYLAIILDGRTPLMIVWAKFSVFPWTRTIVLGTTGLAVRFAGRFLAVAVFLSGMVAASKILSHRLKGSVSVGCRGAWKFAWVHSHALLVVLGGTLLLCTGLISIGILLGMLGRIPWVGPVVLVVSIIPGTMAIIVSLISLIAAVASIVIGPAIVGVEDHDWLDVLLRIAGMAWGVPLRWLGYEITALGVTSIVGVLTAGVALISVALPMVLLGAAAPEIVMGMAVVAGKHVPFLPGLTDWFHTEVMAVPFAFTRNVQVGGVILASLLGCLELLCAGFILSVWAATQVILYGLLRHYNGGANVYETKDVFQRLSTLSARVRARMEHRESHQAGGHPPDEHEDAEKP